MIVPRSRPPIGAVSSTSPETFGAVAMSPPLDPVSCAETLVHVDAGGQTLVAKLPGMVELHVGATVGVNLDRRRLHLFDGAGERLE